MRNQKQKKTLKSWFTNKQQKTLLMSACFGGFCAISAIIFAAKFCAALLLGVDVVDHWGLRPFLSLQGLFCAYVLAVCGAAAFVFRMVARWCAKDISDRLRGDYSGPWLGSNRGAFSRGR